MVSQKLTRKNLAYGFPLTWNVRIPRCPLRVTLTVWAWNYRPPALLAEGAAPNANLNVSIDGVSYKTGLGDGTERKLFEEVVTSKFLTPGWHTIGFELTSGVGAVEAQLEVEC